MGTVMRSIHKLPALGLALALASISLPAAAARLEFQAGGSYMDRAITNHE